MLDINFVRENSEKVKKGTSDKQLDPKIVDEVLALDEKRRELLVKVENLRAERNKYAKSKDIAQGKKTKSKLQKLEPQLKKAEEKFQEALWQIPNLPASDVKEGKD